MVGQYFHNQSFVEIKRANQSYQVCQRRQLLGILDASDGSRVNGFGVSVTVSEIGLLKREPNFGNRQRSSSAKLRN
jgi:hypothetical protein